MLPGGSACRHCPAPSASKATQSRAQGETRGNLAAGGRGEARPLTERDRWIAAEIGPTLREKGLLFVGLDVIGEHLTEINVTSPTCIREIDKAFDTRIGERLMDAIEAKLAARKA